MIIVLICYMFFKTSRVDISIKTLKRFTKPALIAMQIFCIQFISTTLLFTNVVKQFRQYYKFSEQEARHIATIPYYVAIFFCVGIGTIIDKTKFHLRWVLCSQFSLLLGFVSFLDWGLGPQKGITQKSLIN